MGSFEASNAVYGRATRLEAFGNVWRRLKLVKKLPMIFKLLITFEHAKNHLMFSKSLKLSRFNAFSEKHALKLIAQTFRVKNIAK